MPVRKSLERGRGLGGGKRKLRNSTVTVNSTICSVMWISRNQDQLCQLQIGWTTDNTNTKYELLYFFTLVGYCCTHKLRLYDYATFRSCDWLGIRVGGEISKEAKSRKNAIIVAERKIEGENGFAFSKSNYIYIYWWQLGIVFLSKCQYLSFQC